MKASLIINIAITQVALFGANLFAQGGLGNGMNGGQEFPVTTAVPFLLINTGAAWVS